MRILINTLAFLTLFTSCNETLSSGKLLEKSIAYHDPQSNWSTFNGQLQIVMETPNQPNRVSDITINLPNDYFHVKAVRDTTTIVYEMNKGNCHVSLNGKTDFTEEEKKTNRLDCERANMYKNYYTYLYGLPMKLKDPGTNIAEALEHKTFKGKDYLVLKATYDEDVGSDVWYFYFDPETFAMEVYQFFKTDDNGLMKADSGEYILLTEEKEIHGIKMPKVRAWYYNKDDGYLGTDILQ